MFGWRWKNFIRTLTALAFFSAVCLGVVLPGTCKLSKIDGTRTFYLDSASSQSLQKTELSFCDIFRVRGESVRFSTPHGQSSEQIAKELAERLDGEICFSEAACGTVSYYGYAPNLGEGILLYGKRVNLHIAVGEEECAVGCPIIFGGF